MFVAKGRNTLVEPESDERDAEQDMSAILNYIWDQRKEFSLSIPNIEAALAQSTDMAKPVSVVELGDIVSGGGAGDSTEGLRALLNSSCRPAFVGVMDAETVALAQRIGVGSICAFQIGGGDSGYNAKTPVTARVVRISSERVAPTGEVQKGVAIDSGTRVLLQTEDGLNIIVSEYACMNHDKQLLISMGVEPAEMAVILQKTHQMFKAGFMGALGSFIYAATSGYTSRDFASLPYKNVRRPLYPLDKAF